MIKDEKIESGGITSGEIKFIPKEQGSSSSNNIHNDSINGSNVGKDEIMRLIRHRLNETRKATGRPILNNQHKMNVSGDNLLSL